MLDIHPTLCHFFFFSLSFEITFANICDCIENDLFSICSLHHISEQWGYQQTQKVSNLETGTYPSWFLISCGGCTWIFMQYIKPSVFAILFLYGFLPNSDVATPFLMTWLITKAIISRERIWTPMVCVPLYKVVLLLQRKYLLWLKKADET